MPTHTITRTYKGSPSKAAEEFQRDAAKLARQGYHPTSQLYTPGSWGIGAFLLALLLMILLVGILIFIYLIIVKPDGSLVVTYEYRGDPDAARLAAERAVEEAPAVDPLAALTGLADMRDKGLITAEEYDAKKAELLERM